MVIIGLCPLVVFLIAYVIPQAYESLNAALPLGTMYNGFFGTVFYLEQFHSLASGLISFLLNYSLSIQTQVIIQDVLYFIPFLYTGIFLVALYIKQLSEKVTKLFTIFLYRLLCFYAFLASMVSLDPAISNTSCC